MLILDECWMVSLSLRIIKLCIPCTVISCYINFRCQTTRHISINTRYIQVLNPESRWKELVITSYPSDSGFITTCRLNWLLFFIFIACAGSPVYSDITKVLYTSRLVSKAFRIQQRVMYPSIFPDFLFRLAFTFLPTPREIHPFGLVRTYPSPPS